MWASVMIVINEIVICVYFHKICMVRDFWDTLNKTLSAKISAKEILLPQMNNWSRFRRITQKSKSL